MNNISFALNANGDMYIGPDGNLAMVTGVAAVQQDCLCKMRAQQGEMIYQPLDGLPYLTDVWLQKNLAKWQAVARQQLLAVPGVIMVPSISFALVEDILTYTAEIQTVYSQAITITGNISGPLT
jgi:hypothetical protein